MSDNIINSLQGIGKQNDISEAPPVVRLEAPAPVTETGKAAKGDQVQLSDEVKEPETDKGGIPDALKASIAGLGFEPGMVGGGSLGAGGIQGGFEPGVRTAGVFSSKPAG
jgi:hypothetical protein